MKLLDLASYRSFWRGIDYHHEKRVISWKELDKEIYCGEVRGSGNNVYHVQIDMNHPRKSTCDCPFADGRRVICKHMIALDLAVFPEKENQIMQYIEEQEELYEQEIENEREEKIREIRSYVMGLSKSQLREILISRMISDMEEESEYYIWH